ncbi:hypothetical protein DZF97_12075, partial [Clavibacter nebraskensis]
MTPSHDAPDTGPTSFDDGPAPATLGLSRREMRAAERARALALGIDEADDAPVDEAAPLEEPSTTSAPAAPSDGEPAAADSTRVDGSDARRDESTTPQPAPPSAPGVGPDTSAILLSGGVLTRRQLRAIREAEEAARQQRGSEHGHAEPAPSDTDTDTGSAPTTGEHTAAAVDDAPPTSSDASVPSYARYGRGSRATPRPRAPYGSAYRRA